MINMKRTKEENMELCERYPFLIPWNRWSGVRITDAKDGGYWPGNPKAIPEYDYEYTELDSIPDGWQKAFGEQMCEELRNALIEDGDLDEWKIIQLKEKWGGMRLYDNGHKPTSKVGAIIEKYENMSMGICAVCGAPATRVTLGYVLPFCDDCCNNCGNGRSVTIEEYYEKDEE